MGSRLSIRQVGYNYKTWAREAWIIYCDADAEELKKPSVHTDMAVHADARDLLETMAEVLVGRNTRQAAKICLCLTAERDCRE